MPRLTNFALLRGILAAPHYFSGAVSLSTFSQGIHSVSGTSFPYFASQAKLGNVVPDTEFSEDRQLQGRERRRVWAIRLCHRVQTPATSVFVVS
jgi:hypothetical protein